MATTASVPLTGAPNIAVAMPVVRQRSTLSLLMRNRMAMAGAAVVAIWIVLAIVAPLIAPYDPIEQQVRLRLQGPSAVHVLGVDELGRDVFSRVLYGGRVSLPVAAVVVLLAPALGMSEWRVLLRHVLPNSIAPAIVLSTMDFGNAIIITAALSFLGLGAVPPTPEWGAMVAEGRELMQAWWISTFAGLAIFSV